MTAPITIARACRDIDSLHQIAARLAILHEAECDENRLLRNELDQARTDRDTARALLAGMQGRA